MAATKYTYAISTDFPNGVMNSDRLSREIASSTIATTMDRIDTVGNVCDVWFADALLTAEETTLGLSPTPGPGTIVGDHTGAVFDPVHQEHEYARGNLVRHTRYATENPDGTLTDKFEELICTYSGSSISSETQTLYNPDGTVASSETLNYETEKVAGNKVIRLKRA